MSILSQQNSIPIDNLNYPTLLEWLYSTGNYRDDHTNQNISSGALIVFPQIIDRWNISALIVQQWEGYNVFIVTDYPNEFTQIISHNSIDKNWSNIEFMPFSLVKYSDISDINDILQNTEIDIVLFDDARMLATISSGVNFISVQPKIIVLTSWGDTYAQLDTITSKLPNIRLLSLDVITDFSNIKWNLIKVPMSSRQLSVYNQIRKQELDKNLETSTLNSSKPLPEIPYSKTRAITLYVYPDNTISNLLQDNPICELDNILISNPSLNINHFDTLSSDGPKLDALLDGIVSNWPRKQIIFTRYNHFYGVDLIMSFLHLMSQTNKNPYEPLELFHISCTDNYDNIINSLHKFNQSNSAILISNIIPFISLKHVSAIHVIDNYYFPSIKMLIDRCHKKYLNDSIENLNIFSYVATHPDETSSDLSLYHVFSQDIQNANRIYNGLFSSGSRIVFEPLTGLLVI